MKHLFSALLILLVVPGINAQDYSALSFRSLGPATTSGRVADMAVDPNNHDVWFVATASGGVWKTVNHGLTFSPLFDNEGSYSIGCVTIDPSNSNTIWVGTGENNNQRSVAYGDGIYKSVDGGASFKNMGLGSSEHIGMIAVHPDNSDIVWAAAYGPLWSSGGDRGIYKTTDGGESWKRVLHVSEHTGFNEVHLDPRNPNILYATAHQRRRHVFTYLSGGPESGLYLSKDGGENWEELNGGLPSDDKGRLALAIAPSNPDVLYLMIEGHGTYRSNNRGLTFSKRNDHNTSGNYYVELVVSPHDADVVYSMDTYMHWSNDGGSTFKRLGEKGKHVDNHVCWIDPLQPLHLIVGSDGGLYETWDHGVNWHYKPNLPITQFYRVTVDNALPFYNIYGGTQDNFSLGGPSRTINDRGIINSDWFVTQTGDGFESQIDPEDPNTIYAQAQYGWLQRYDRLSGEGVAIKPVEGVDEKPYRFNWDAPLLISPHDHKTLYFAANVVFKSTDRGNNWAVISDDLSQQIDRNTLPVMGKLWSVDAVAKHRSTSIYGNIVALNESSVSAGLLYAGTDDGLIHVSHNDGGNWKTLKSFPGIPANTYVNDIKTSLHDANRVYAVFNNHKQGDFAPYILVSNNQGKSWKSIVEGLPERGSVYSLAEDHVDPNLLFAGTEFGLHVSTDGGKNWKALDKGLPTVAVRDIDIQRRENDLVLATFGRGFYVLDDYSALREISQGVMDKSAHVFDIKDGLLYHEAHPIGYGPPGFMGASYYMADNPPVGVTFTYHIKEAPESLKAARQSAEKDQGDNVTFPSYDDLLSEDRDKDHYLLLAISDNNGKPLRRLKTSYSKGMHRITWDGKVSRHGSPKHGAYFVNEGGYRVQLVAYASGQFDTLTEPVSFAVRHLNNLNGSGDPAIILAFQDRANATNRRFNRLTTTFASQKDRVKQLQTALTHGPSASLADALKLEGLETDLLNMAIELYGDKTLTKRETEAATSLSDRLSMATWGSYGMRSNPTGTMVKQLDIVTSRLPSIEKELLEIVQGIDALMRANVDAGGPYLEPGLNQSLNLQ